MTVILYNPTIMTKSSTDARVLSTLKSIFGYSSFWPLQEEVVHSLLHSQDVFVLLPTGGGKSLCYQLPAILLEGMTVVVSPLIALMKDQVDKLQALGVAATFINSSLDSSEIGRRQADVVAGRVKLLYVAPERLMIPRFLKMLSEVRLASFAIDEAHCISEWGHDFRPEYRQLKMLRRYFPATPLGAFTATATRRVQADIKDQLGLDGAACYQGSFNRPNLYYEVRPKRRAYQQLTDYLRTRKGSSGIIYCFSRDGTERLADKLRMDGFSAASYHAGLDGAERRRRQEAFVKDNIQIIVATIAFGLGIDKPDVRFVVHYDVPKTLEGYYQESGRAGRDGEASDCILFFSSSDVTRHLRFINEKPTEEERDVALHQLQQMANWAKSHQCRRRALLAYFDESLKGQQELCCDVCSAPSEEEDYTIPAQMFLSCVKRTGERFGITHIVDVLRGSRSRRVLQLGHDRLSTYGIGGEHSRDEWMHLAHHLLSRGFIRQAQEEFNVVKITSLGRAVLLKQQMVMIPSLVSHTARIVGAGQSEHEALFEELRILRKRLADERAIPPYVIFHDSVLRQMADHLPSRYQDLLRLHGVGQRKAEDYGAVFLACIADYVCRTGAKPVSSSAPPSVAIPRSKGGLSATVRATLDLFNDGCDVATIANARQLTVGTIEGHLAEAIRAGEPVPIEDIIGAEKRMAIEAAMAELGSSPLKPIMERLGNEYTYGELRLVQAALERTDVTRS